MAIPVPDLNPLENEWVELKCQHGSGNLERLCMEEVRTVLCSEKPHGGATVHKICAGISDDQGLNVDLLV